MLAVKMLRNNRDETGAQETIDRLHNRRVPWQGPQAEQFVLAILIAAAVVFFTVRLPVGIDLADESYYLTHIVEWLRKGFAQSDNLNIQQLSALFVYPFARAVISSSGDLSGAILFLRMVYAGTVMATCLPLYFFLRRLRPAPTAALGAMLLIGFIPFGLPAPSYNTIALCGMTAALSLFGLALLDAREDWANGSKTRVRSIVPLIVSAAFWGIAVVSYPTLAPAPVLQIALAFLLAPSNCERRFAVIYALCGIFAAAVLAAILTAIFGFGHLVAMVDYTTASAQLSAGLWGKVTASAARLMAQPLVGWAFAGVLILPLILGHRKPRLMLNGLIYFAMFIIMVTSEAAAYIKSHDIIILAALFGATTACRGTEDYAIRIIWVTSIGSALITAATSAGGIFNVPIGGFMAACLALVLATPRTGEPSRLLRVIGHAPLVLTLVVVGYVSQTFIYGEAPPQRPINGLVMKTGPYEGLRTAPETQRFITEVSAAFSAYGQEGKTITVFGPASSLYLLTDMTPHALSTWSLRSSSGERARRMTEAFLDRYPPDFIAIYRDPWTEPLGLMEKGRLRQYRNVSTIKIGWREFELFLRSELP